MDPRVLLAVDAAGRRGVDLHDGHLVGIFQMGEAANEESLIGLSESLFPPASRTRTDVSLSSVRVLAITAPAGPVPTTMKSNTMSPCLVSGLYNIPPPGRGLESLLRTKVEYEPVEPHVCWSGPADCQVALCATDACCSACDPDDAGQPRSMVSNSGKMTVHKPRRRLPAAASGCFRRKAAHARYPECAATPPPSNTMTTRSQFCTGFLSPSVGTGAPDHQSVSPDAHLRCDLDLQVLHAAVPVEIVPRLPRGKAPPV